MSIFLLSLPSSTISIQPQKDKKCHFLKNRFCTAFCPLYCKSSLQVRFLKQKKGLQHSCHSSRPLFRHLSLPLPPQHERLYSVHIILHSKEKPHHSQNHGRGKMFRTSFIHSRDKTTNSPASPQDANFLPRPVLHFLKICKI